MSGVWTCPICGELYFSESKMRGCTHGRLTKPCPTCQGKGFITGGALEPNIECPFCHGTKVVQIN